MSVPNPMPGTPTTYPGGSSGGAADPWAGANGGAGVSGGSLGGDYLGGNTSTTTSGNLGQMGAAGGVVPLQGTNQNPQYNQATSGVQGNQTAGFQYGMADSGAIDQSKIAPGQMPNMSVQGSTPYNQQMLNAFYGEQQKRLDPQWSQRQSDLETQAQNMGLTRGSEAWNREMQNFSGQRNDAYGSAMNSAILNSGAEGQRAQNMDIAAGNFGNQATQQNYENQLSSQNQQAAMQNQQYNQDLGRANLNNSAIASQQGAAQGWKGLETQAEGNRLSAEASRYGADKSYAGQAAMAGASTANAQLNAALQQRQIQNQERQQDFDMSWAARNNAVDYQDKLAKGMHPGDPNFSTLPPVQGASGLQTATNTANQAGNSAIADFAGRFDPTALYNKATGFFGGLGQPEQLSGPGMG